jgi:hypothetical protein
MEPSLARSYIVGLLVECPFEPNPTDCALQPIRKKPLKERIEWVNQLTDDQVRDIISEHKECLKRKERG